MASPRSRRVLMDVRKLNDNHLCFECGSPNPQWASVTYGTWICLECSGKHRSLGVHLSFVRSINMDKWKELELEKMKVGGNRHANEFFTAQSDYRENWTFQEKYNSRAASLLRDKISTEASGNVWSEETSSARFHQPPLVTGSSVSGNRQTPSTYLKYSPNNHESDLEEWLKDTHLSSSNYQSDGHQAETCTSESWMNHSYPARQHNSISSFSMGSHSESEYSWQSGWTAVSQLAAAAAKRTSQLAVQAGRRTKELGQSVQGKLHDSNILDSFSKGVENVTAKLQTVKVQGLRSLENYWATNPTDGDHSTQMSADLAYGTAHFNDETVADSHKKHSVNNKLDYGIVKNEGNLHNNNNNNNETCDWDLSENDGWSTVDWSTGYQQSASRRFSKRNSHDKDQ